MTCSYGSPLAGRGGRGRFFGLNAALGKGEVVRIRLYFFKLHRADRDALGSAVVLAAHSGSGELCFFIYLFLH